MLPVIAAAQVTISGRVTDKKSPVIGASISLKDSYDGATTDSSGNFSFKTSEKGDQVIVVSSVGYKSFEQKIRIEGSKVNMDVVLKEDVTELRAVVITAGTFEASDKKKTTVLNPIDIVTTASGNGDVTGALKTLPGAQQIGESEGLFVRGGTAGETKTYIDGTLVNDFFYSSVPNIAQRGRFSPFLFKGTVFSTGGYSALYGQAMSSALILESIDLPDKTSANIGISVIGVNAGYQQLAKDKRSSWGISYGFTDLSLGFKLFKQKQDYFTIPQYHTGDANFRIKTSATGMIKYYGYFSANHLGFRRNSLDSAGYQDMFKLKNFNMYHNLSYKESLGRKWRLVAGVSYTQNEDRIGSQMQNMENGNVTLTGLEFKNFNLALPANYFNAKFVLEKKLSGLSAIRFGSEYNYSHDRSDYSLSNGQQFTGIVKESITSVFAEGDIYITNNVAAKIGTRLEHSTMLDKTNIAPRVSLAYKLAKESQLSVAYGIFYQDPERRYLPTAQPLAFSRATHYIAQYQRVTNLVTLRVEAFYKKYNDLILTSDNGGGQAVATNNNGYGDAKGFEIFWRDKKTVKDLDYWISYSYLDTKRLYLNYPTAIQPNFAAKHTASLVLKKFVTKWKTGFNASYNYASGRPYYNIVNNGAGYKFNDKGMTPDYHNVSFSLNYIPSIGKTNSKSFVVYVVSVSNIFGLKQVYGYEYSYDGMHKQPIVPTGSTFVYIGAFISFGIDRTQDAINNNLSLKI
jgi:hypothetical protein